MYKITRVIHLWCDDPKCTPTREQRAHHTGSVHPPLATVSGPSYEALLDTAAQLGWLFTGDGTICPWCAHHRLEKE